MIDYSKNPGRFLNPYFSGWFFALTWLLDYITTLVALQRGFVETNKFWATWLSWAWIPIVAGILFGLYVPYRKYLIPFYLALIAIGILHLYAALMNLWAIE